MKACRNTRHHCLAHFNIEKQLKGSSVESEKVFCDFIFIFLDFCCFCLDLYRTVQRADRKCVSKKGDGIRNDAHKAIGCDLNVF